MKIGRYRYIKRRFRPYLRKEYQPGYTILTLTLASLSIFGSFAIRPTLATVVHLQKKIKEGREANKVLEKKIEDLSLAEGEVQKIQKDLPLLEKALPQEARADSLLETLSFLSGKNGLSLLGIRFGKEEALGTPLPNKKISPEKLPLTLRASGTFPDFLEFLRDLEKNPRPVKIEEIQIVKMETKGELRIEAGLRGETYFHLVQNE